MVKRSYYQRSNSRFCVFNTHAYYLTIENAYLTTGVNDNFYGKISHPAHLDEYLCGVLGGVQKLLGGGHLSQFQRLLLKFLFKVRSLSYWLSLINELLIIYDIHVLLLLACKQKWKYKIKTNYYRMLWHVSKKKSTC